jgi:hypothetical protein
VEKCVQLFVSYSSRFFVHIIILYILQIITGNIKNRFNMGNVCNCLCKKKARPQLDLDEDRDGNPYAPPLDPIPEEDNTPPSDLVYTPQVPRPTVRRSRRIAQKRMRTRGMALEVIDAFMDPRAEL